MSWEPVKCFWVEQTGKWRAHIWRKGVDGARECLGEFASEQLAEQAVAPYWEREEIQSSSRSQLYRLPDGREVDSHELPPGALYDAHWLHECYPMPDGICLAAVCPNGHTWIVDSRASNCTMPEDKVHRCWIRHGDPKTGNVHVDKDGCTCAAGAGSIMCGSDAGTPGHYHGHLHNGAFTAG